VRPANFAHWPVSNILLPHDKRTPWPADGPEYARIGYFFAISAARKSIDIANAYFIPDDLAVEALIRARQRGVRVRSVVPAINDTRFGRAASRSRWGPLLEAGDISASFLEPRVAAAHRGMFENDISRCRRFTFEEFQNRPFYIKAVDHFARLFRSQL